MPAVNLITSLPTFVSPEEHTTLVASTPNSFSDIPPVIRHKEENVSVSLDPPLENLSTQNATRGTLYVLTSVLVFMSTTGTGFQIEYPAITLHAVSRGESGPSIYCQLDESIGTENAASAADENAVTDMRELSIVPQNPESLEAIFEALSQCASLHPDPQDDEDDFDEAIVDLNGSTFDTFNGDENEELSEVGRVRSDFLNDNRFAPY
ncbi:hypothetical protein GALMADRAFT_244609 [Galerina marginata CBS 339.88]|uniref:Methylosome subunit pICln n=1 Tax=Galerina marginata (strain CBS 339.88) TaxID=685588 RepID=A0A067TJ43_GALM3|nr:hypothetical protein GALMADRAFT_244609 [Galerina marginata CBS 339.88]